MANSNPSPETRFKPGNNGRPKEARDRITRKFLTALADDFEQNGPEVVARVRQEDPSTYLRVYAAIIPREIEITRPLDSMSDADLTAAIQTLTEAIRAQTPPPPEEQPEQMTVN